MDLVSVAHVSAETVQYFLFVTPNHSLAHTYSMVAIQNFFFSHLYFTIKYFFMQLYLYKKSVTLPIPCFRKKFLCTYSCTVCIHCLLSFHFRMKFKATYSMSLHCRKLANTNCLIVISKLEMQFYEL